MQAEGDHAVPRTAGEIVATAHDESGSAPFCAPPPSGQGSGHPLRHAAMCAVQRVAALHRERDGVGDAAADPPGKRKLPSTAVEHAARCSNMVASSHTSPCSTRRPDLAGGPSTADVGAESVPEGKGVQYLCTGYDAFLSCEPCAMCAMALVHARVRRVFFGAANPAAGALGSRWAVHLQGSLNHHYEVYRGLLAAECPQFPSPFPEE